MEYQLGTTRMVGDRVSRIRRSTEEHDVIDDDVPCFATKGRPGGTAVHFDHREAVISVLNSTVAETRTEHTNSSTVLSVEEDLVTPDLLSLEIFLQA